MDTARLLAERLFERHHLTLFRFFRRMVGSRAAAQDLTQETFVQVVRSAASYAEAGRELPWLLQIANRLLLDRYRREGRAPEIVSLEEEEEISVEEGEELTRLDLDRALGRLPYGERQAFLLREVVGLSYREIAEIEGTTTSAVKGRLLRARRRLGQLLNAARPGSPRLVVRRREP